MSVVDTLDLTIFGNEDAVTEFLQLIQTLDTQMQAIEGDLEEGFLDVFHYFFVPPQITYIEAHANWPTWLQWLGWNTRNPLPGLNDQLGCKGQIFTTVGTTVSPQNPHGLSWTPVDGNVDHLVHTVTKNGKKYSYFSIRGKYIETYFGTRPTGSFGVALRRAHAPGY